MSKYDFTNAHKMLFPLYLEMEHLNPTSRKQLLEIHSLSRKLFNTTEIYYHYRSFCMSMNYINKDCGYAERFNYSQLTEKGRECLTHKTCDDCDYKFACSFDLDVANEVPQYRA